MKNPYEVLRIKEAQLREIQVQVEALRIAGPLLSEERESQNDSNSAAQVTDKSA